MTSNTNDSRPSFTPHLVVGFGLIFFGVVLALDRLGIVPAWRGLAYWPVGLILLGVAMVVQALRGPSAPSAGGNQNSVAPAIMLLVFVLVFMRPFRHDSVARDAGGRQELVAVMSGDQRTTTSVDEPFRGAHMTSVMGGTELDLRKATVPAGEPVVVEVFALMGAAILRVPPDWVVDLKVTPIMGGVKDDRRRRQPTAETADEAPVEPRPAPPRIIVRGFVMMGGVTIKG